MYNQPSDIIRVNIDFVKRSTKHFFIPVLVRSIKSKTEFLTTVLPDVFGGYEYTRAIPEVLESRVVDSNTGGYLRCGNYVYDLTDVDNSNHRAAFDFIERNITSRRFLETNLICLIYEPQLTPKMFQTADLILYF
jgi:hypothetical protein